MSMKKLTELRDKLEEQFKTLPNEYGYIVYVYDRGADGQGIGFNRHTDKGDAMVAIERIAEQFNINLGVLASSI